MSTKKIVKKKKFIAKNVLGNVVVSVGSENIKLHSITVGELQSIAKSKGFTKFRVVVDGREILNALKFPAVLTKGKVVILPYDTFAF